MAECVESTVYDTDIDQAVSSCMVHCHVWPCPRNGQPANETPVETWERPGDRAAIVNEWELRTKGQRPLLIHRWEPRDFLPDGRLHDGRDCWCNPEFLPAREPG